MGHIIGLHGATGSGKDTLGAFFVDRLGYFRLAFADAAYQEVAAAFDVPESKLRDRLWKATPQAGLQVSECNDQGFIEMVGDRFPKKLHGLRTSRELMQLWGTEYRRAQNPEYWVRKLDEVIEKHKAYGFEHFVVTDLRRYPMPGRASEFSDNEATYLKGKAKRCTIIELVRHEHVPSNGHLSDTRLPQALIDFTVVNNGTPEDLFQTVIQLEY